MLSGLGRTIRFGGLAGHAASFAGDFAAAMRARLAEYGKTCVFSEPPLRPKLADTLSAGLPVKLAELDGLGGYTPATAQGYEHVLSKLADDLAGCLESL